MSNQVYNYCALLWAVVLSSFVGSVPERTYDLSYLDETMKDEVNFNDVRGASIAFFDKYGMEEPILRGYGRVASSDNSALVDKDTVFLLASVSKVFTGTAVLKLVDLGILSSIDDDICNVVPDGMTCRNPFFDSIPVTWRMLMTHRSSLKGDVPSFPNPSNDRDDDDDDSSSLEAGYGPTGGYYGFAAGNPNCPLEDVTGFYRDILVDQPTETQVGADLGVQWYTLAQQQMNGMWQKAYAPGARVEYSNFATGFIAALVEWATNQTFPDFTRQYIFEPLNMTNTAWFRRDLPNVQEAMPVEATYYRRGQKWDDIGHYCFIDYASGSLLSSATDMAKFLDSMLNYGTPGLWNDTGLGEQALGCLERNTDGTVIVNCEFGANWILLGEKDDEEEWLDPYGRYDWTHGAHHDGAEAGSQTQILLLPQAGVYAVVLTNTDGNDEYAAQWIASELLYEITSGGTSTAVPKAMTSFALHNIVTLQITVPMLLLFGLLRSP